MPVGHPLAERRRCRKAFPVGTWKGGQFSVRGVAYNSTLAAVKAKWTRNAISDSLVSIDQRETFQEKAFVNSPDSVVLSSKTRFLKMD